MDEKVESIDRQETSRKPAHGNGQEAYRNASGSIEKATVASRTPLANPSANDMKTLWA
jgi:hypothetical protein